MADADEGLQVIDIGRDANPQSVGRYDTTGGARNIAISGQLAYGADSHGGLQLIDITDLANPRRIGGYQTGSAAAVAVVGGYASSSRTSGSLVTK